MLLEEGEVVVVAIVLVSSMSAKDKAEIEADEMLIIGMSMRGVEGRKGKFSLNWRYPSLIERVRVRVVGVLVVGVRTACV